MDQGHFAILLLVVGLAILVAEVFVPSGGVLAVVTVGCLAASGFFAVSEWWGTNPAAFWLYVASVAVLLPGTFVGSFLMLPRTKFGRRLLQEPPSEDEVTPFAREQDELEALIGRRGTTMTPHGPGGMVEIAGRRLHAEARGLMLDAGQPVEVVGLKGNRLVVRLADRPAPSPAEPAPEPEPARPPTPIAPDATRPGGKIAADAPVGYPDPPAETPADADPGEIADPFAEEAGRAG